MHTHCNREEESSMKHPGTEYNLQNYSWCWYLSIPALRPEQPKVRASICISCPCISSVIPIQRSLLSLYPRHSGRLTSTCFPFLQEHLHSWICNLHGKLSNFQSLYWTTCSISACALHNCCPSSPIRALICRACPFPIISPHSQQRMDMDRSTLAVSLSTVSCFLGTEEALRMSAARSVS